MSFVAFVCLLLNSVSPYPKIFLQKTSKETKIVFAPCGKNPCSMEIKMVLEGENSEVSWRDSRGAIALVCVFLIAITWFVFGQTVRYDFVNYDDDTYVYANPLISSGLTVPGAIYAFT